MRYYFYNGNLQNHGVATQDVTRRKLKTTKMMPRNRLKVHFMGVLAQNGKVKKAPMYGEDTRIHGER